MYVALIYSVILLVAHVHRKGKNVYLFVFYIREERIQLKIFLVRFFSHLKTLTSPALIPIPIGLFEVF